MSTAEKQISDDGSRRKVIIIVAVVAAIILATLFYFLMRASSGVRVDPTLDGAIRAGSPEFAELQPKIVLDAPEATESKRALGDIVMSLQTVARNFTGRTLAGLEIKGSVVDHQNNAVRERTIVVIPTSRHPELAPNRTMYVQVQIEGMTDADDRANIRMEVTGFKFK
jgi:flagellar basal body-associated protein FliL